MSLSASPPLMRTPRRLDLEVTSHCNLRCRYCYYFGNDAVEYRDLPTADWLTFFAELGALRVMDVTLSGGEAISRPDFPELISGIVAQRMRFSVLSNGALIDDRLATFLAGTGRCQQVQISIDGARPETHDAGRGDGSFAKAVRGLRTLQRHGVPVAVRVTIHRHNVGDLDATARFLLEELGLPGFSTNAAGYLGACRSQAADLLLTVADRGLAMTTLLRLNEQYGGRIAAAAGPLAEGRMWGRMEQARRDRAEAFPRCGHLTACGCPFSKLAVRADGVIVPCSMLPHLELGRINQDSLQQVWQHHPVLHQLRSRRQIRLADLAYCRGCDYSDYCTGNCPGLAYSLTGQLDQPSPDACLRRYVHEGGALSFVPS